MTNSSNGVNLPEDFDGHSNGTVCMPTSLTKLKINVTKAKMNDTLVATKGSDFNNFVQVLMQAQKA